MSKVIVALAVYLAGSVCACAATITLTGVGTYTQGPIVTYTETVSPSPGSPYASVEESASPCPVMTTGCNMAAFSVLFPQIVIPAGYSVVSAQIELNLNAGLVDPFPQLISVTSIDPTKPFSAGLGGSYGRLFSAACSLCDPYTDATTDYAHVVGDFTSEVEQAMLSTNGILSAFTGNWHLFFGFKTALSATPGINDVSVYQSVLSAPTGSVTGSLLITIATPEPATFGLLALAVIAAINARRSGHLPKPAR